MLKISIAFLITFLSLSGFAESTVSSNKHQQMIVVKTKDWDSISANISLYEKENNSTKWKLIKDNFPSVMGKKGMGWGRGIYNYEDAINNTFRKEGDKRAPAGLFSIGTVFGIAPKEEAIKELSLKMPYIYLYDSIQCVGEGGSDYYNMIIDTNTVKKDWKDDSNNERMRYEGLRDEMAYKWGFFINHNVDSNPDPRMKRDKNSGSCIFMHLWKNQETGTSGCTALQEDNMKDILKWLDQEKNPAIVQLPEAEYERVKTKWELP